MSEVVFYMIGVVSGISLGLCMGTSNKYISYDAKDKAYHKGFKMGYRKGLEEAEKKLVEKLKGLK